MRALVTGATGFIGGAVARMLLAEGHAVRALVRPGSRLAPELADVERIPGDLEDAAAVRRAVRGCEAVFHVAALYSLSGRDEELRRVNVDGTRHVLEASLAEGVGRVVHTSSVATVSPARATTASDETCFPDPASLPGPYKRSKWASEELARAFARRGLDVVIVNPTFPVGEGDVKPTPTGRVILDFLRGRMPAYVDTGLNVVDVDDVARGHLLAFRHGRAGERYLLGHRNMTLRALLGELGRVVGRPPPRLRLPHALAYALGVVDRVVEERLLGREPRIPLEAVRTARHFMFVDCGRAVRELGLPQTPVPVALDKAVRWFERHGYLRPPQHNRTTRSRSR